MSNKKYNKDTAETRIKHTEKERNLLSVNSKRTDIGDDNIKKEIGKRRKKKALLVHSEVCVK